MDIAAYRQPVPSRHACACRQNVESAHEILVGPKSPARPALLALNDWYARSYTLLWCHLPFNFPAKLYVRHIGLNFTWVESNNDGFTTLALQLTGHMSQHLVEGSFGGSICRKSVFHLAKALGRARVARYECNGANRSYILQ